MTPSKPQRYLFLKHELENEFTSCLNGVSPMNEWHNACHKKSQQLLVWDWSIGVVATPCAAMPFCSLIWIRDRQMGPLKRHPFPQQNLFWVLLKVTIEVGNLFSLFSTLPAWSPPHRGLTIFHEAAFKCLMLVINILLCCGILF